YDEIQALDPDGDGVIPLAGGYLIRGNGNQDDNREEAFFFQSPAGIMAAMPPIIQAATNFRERRIVAAYKDFGHLKVMPAADAANSNETRLFRL
ncbi:hypothetical protein LJB99_05200, partial [Deltaproteobacteria bacterium OttesenSCG-928-K17]|nr:hypothetical protein [Deltaproteobacteria bacterium OttesenSCG-928-K17]